MPGLIPKKAAVTGDVSALLPPIVTGLQGKPISPTAPAKNQALIWSGSAWTPGNKVTSGTMASGPPGSPGDGDVWIALAAGANGENWQFRYNAGSASAFKWEFIGGSPVVVENTTSQTLTASTWSLLNTPTLSAPRSGDYLFVLLAGGITGAASTQQIGISQNSTTTVVATPAAESISATGFNWTLSANWKLTGLNANDVMGLMGWSNSAATTFVGKAFSLIPVRIS